VLANGKSLKKAKVETGECEAYHATERIPRLGSGPQGTPALSGPLPDRLPRTAKSFGNPDFRGLIDLNAERMARPDDTNWTGAEIKSCCRLASLLDVPLVQAAQNVVPVAVTAGDKIEGLRQWASGRCLSADRAGVYSRSEGVSGGRIRRVVREPGVN
jgi:hypothetical protein